MERGKRRSQDCRGRQKPAGFGAAATLRRLRKATKSLVRLLQTLGGRAIGLCGLDVGAPVGHAVQVDAACPPCCAGGRARCAAGHLGARRAGRSDRTKQARHPIGWRACLVAAIRLERMTGRV